MGGFKLYFPADEDDSHDKPSPSVPASTSDVQSLKTLDNVGKDQQTTCTPPDTDAKQADGDPTCLRSPSWKQDQSEAVAHPTTSGREKKTYREHTLGHAEKKDKRRTSLSIPSLEAAEEKEELAQEMNFRSYVVGGRRRSSAQRSADYYAFMDGMAWTILVCASFG
jgi:hypothetical protein